jgi:hypothetical protein
LSTPAAWQKLAALAIIAALAVALTVSGMLKPILWDEEIYRQFAEHISHNPGDPSGAILRFTGQVAVGMNVLAPPLMLYWWAGAIALLGPSVGISAIALLPFALAYVASTYSLSRRFAPGFESPLTVMAAMSAWALVSFNYMLDFPAVALGLSALAMFIAGADAKATRWIVAAGVFAGLALETKYNAAAALAAIVLYGMLAQRPVQAVLALGIAVALFTATELAIFLKYGQSHFLLHLHSHAAGSNTFIREISRFRVLLYGLVESAGPLAIGVLLIAPIALNATRRLIIANAILVIAAFGLAAVGFDRGLGHLIPGLTPATLPTLLTLSGLLGLLWVTQTARLTGRWLFRAGPVWDRDSIFLIGWLAISVLAYFLMSPFPAARRLGDVLLASILIVGRAMALARPQRNVSSLWSAVAFHAACGLVMLSIVLVDGRNMALTAHKAVTTLRANASEGETWHLSTLAMDRYLTAAGIRRVEFLQSELRAGDLLMVGHGDKDTVIEFNAEGLQQIAIIREGINLGIRVSTEFYRHQLPWVAQDVVRPTALL